MDINEILTHLGENREEYYNAVSPPVIQTSNFAVSYTHLRAHETVLDLVCRLLLAKKKKHTNKKKQKIHNHITNSTALEIT